MALIAQMVRALQWHHDGRDSVIISQPRDCLLSRWFRRRLNKTSKLRVTCLCAPNSPVPGEFPAKMSSYAENFSIWWRHHSIRHESEGLGFESSSCGSRHFLSQKLWHFRKNTRSCVENECCCPCTVTISSVDFTSTIKLYQLANAMVWIVMTCYSRDVNLFLTYVFLTWAADIRSRMEPSMISKEIQVILTTLI